MAAELAAARRHYDAEEFGDARVKSKLAAQSLRASGDKDGAVEAIRLEVLALVGTDKRKEALELAKSELDTSRRGSDKKGEAMMLLSMASVNMDKPGLKQQEEALLCATEARALFGQSGNKDMEVEALHVMSACSARTGGTGAGREALTYASGAREFCIESGNKRLEALSLHWMSQAHAAMGDLDAALQDADESLDIHLELKDRKMEAFELVSMAHLHLQKGVSSSFERAISDAEDALEIHQTMTQPTDKEVSAFGALFQVYSVKGDKRRALRTAREAVKRFKAVGNKRAEGEALDMLTSAYVATGQYGDALDAAERALGIFQDSGHQQLEAKLSSIISGLHLQMAQFDRALQHGEDAAMLFRETGGETTEKSGAMFNIVESHMQKKDFATALQSASEMRHHFQKDSDTKGEAAALMCMCQVSSHMEKHDDAVSWATRAQVMLGEGGFQYGEGAALRMLAEVLAKKDEHKQAIRAAERSRTIFRELGEKEEEANSLFVVGQEAVALAVAEGARVGEPPGSRAATDALSKAAKSAEVAVKMGREALNVDGLLGASLCVLAQVHMLHGRPGEALVAADEAVVLFRDAASAISEANALLLSADALRMTMSNKDAGDAAEEALRLFRSLDPPDERGESLAQEILSHLAEIKQQQQAALERQRQMAQQGSNMMTMMTPEDSGAPPEQAVSVARQERERGAALDISGADLAMIKAKVQEVATRITGAEEGEIDDDTPLMEAGLTSNSAILLRDELSQELPGVSLPVTLVFDYPSIGAMAELIVENSSKAIKR